MKTVIFPSDLVSSILYHVKNNSDTGIETLRTHGGRLGCDNKLRVTQLLTPKTGADIFIFTMDRNKDIKPWELDYRLKQSSKSTKVTD